jgi:hypothetical protein
MDEIIADASFIYGHSLAVEQSSFFSQLSSSMDSLVPVVLVVKRFCFLFCFLSSFVKFFSSYRLIKIAAMLLPSFRKKIYLIWLHKYIQIITQVFEQVDSTMYSVFFLHVKTKYGRKNALTVFYKRWVTFSDKEPDTAKRRFCNKSEVFEPKIPSWLVSPIIYHRTWSLHKQIFSASSALISTTTVLTCTLINSRWVSSVIYEQRRLPVYNTDLW